MNAIGKILVFAGIFLIVIGIILWFGGNKLNWFGKLPGDIRIEKENFRFYFPIVTMLLLSLIVSLIIKLIQRLL